MSGLYRCVSSEEPIGCFIFLCLMYWFLCERNEMRGGTAE